jgi:lipopolysaccharide transport protein LptA
MAASLPDTSRRYAVAALACCLGAAAVAASPPSLPLPRPTNDPIDLVAASSDVDYRNNKLRFTKVRITQGPMSIEADEASATGLNFENSEWTFAGNVRMQVPDGDLAASDAVVTFRDREIGTAVIRGKPAEFRQKLKDSAQVAQGRANTIDYDVKAGKVTLSGAAWLSDGDNTIQGDTLVYDVARQSVAANPGGTTPGGVRITINPQSPEFAGDKDKTKPRDKTGGATGGKGTGKDTTKDSGTTVAPGGDSATPPANPPGGTP